MSITRLAADATLAARTMSGSMAQANGGAQATPNH